MKNQVQPTLLGFHKLCFFLTGSVYGRECPACSQNPVKKYKKSGPTCASGFQKLSFFLIGSVYGRDYVVVDFQLGLLLGFQNIDQWWCETDF